MAQITLTIPNAQLTRIDAALCIPQHGYTGFLADGVTPQSKIDFLKFWLGKQLKQVVKQYESAAAAQAAQDAAINDVENNLTIT